jgi:hypothetical protein
VIVIEVIYLEGFHIPSNSEIAFIGTIVDSHIQNMKLSVKEIVDSLFAENHQKIFGKNDHLVAGYPDSIIIYFGGRKS